MNVDTDKIAEIIKKSTFEDDMGTLVIIRDAFVIRLADIYEEEDKLLMTGTTKDPRRLNKPFNKTQFEKTVGVSR